MHGRGPSGPDEKGRLKDLQSQYDKVWHHSLKEDVAKAVAALEDDGIFDRSETFTEALRESLAQQSKV